MKTGYNLQQIHALVRYLKSEKLYENNLKSGFSLLATINYNTQVVHKRILGSTAIWEKSLTKIREKTICMVL